MNEFSKMLYDIETTLLEWQGDGDGCDFFVSELVHATGISAFFVEMAINGLVNDGFVVVPQYGPCRFSWKGFGRKGNING